jgi:hypothetical protein
MAIRDGSESAAARRWERLPQPVTAGEGRRAVRLELRAQGRDLLLMVGGGEAHVGAVAVESPADPLGPASADLIVVPGHKEGPLAAECARAVAVAAGCTCTAVVGIHQDAATPDEIAAIVANVRRGLATLVGKLAAPPSD